VEQKMPMETPDKKSSLLQLFIEAKEVTWMKAIIDGKTIRELSLKPGDSLTLDAVEKYNLLIGNAGGITLKLNGKSVPVPGGSGQVINLVLP
jgi:cytoskeleton protein RodZ